jgi:signal transduction histidine kinase
VANGPSNRALSFLDWFLSPRLREASEQDLQRARVLVGASFLMQLMLAALSVDLFLSGVSCLSTALSTLVWFALLPMLRFGYEKLAGIWIASYSQVAMLFVALHSDSSYVVLDPWQAVMIMMSLYFVGTWFGALSVAVVIAEMFTIPVLKAHGMLIDTPLLLNRGASAADDCLGFLLIFLLGWLYSSARDEATTALKATLYTLSESREQYQMIAEGTDAVPFSYNLSDRLFNYIGPQAAHLFGWPLQAWSNELFIDQLLPAESSSRLRQALSTAVPGQRMQLECDARNSNGQTMVLRVIATVRAEFGMRTLVGLILDITELRRLESELRQAQKLESVGRLASGVAHEINTPVQFVSDSVDFLGDASGDLLELVRALRLIRRSTLEGTTLQQAIANAERAEEAADLDYLLESVPLAFDRAKEGLGRVAAIVRSMKEYAHPDAKEKANVDLNRAIENTLTIARHEYRQVADVETHFAKLPLVFCFAGEINQALLNIIVNAAHSLDDVMKASGKRGKITVTTQQEGEQILISIADTGTGIPDAIRERIFDPFFTTKSVGKGTGQGLSVARSVIVDKHQGELWLTSEVGKGTTFFIRLPIEGKPALGTQTSEKIALAS